MKRLCLTLAVLLLALPAVAQRDPHEPPVRLLPDLEDADLMRSEFRVLASTLTDKEVLETYDLAFDLRMAEIDLLSDEAEWLASLDTEAEIKAFAEEFKAFAPEGSDYREYIKNPPPLPERLPLIETAAEIRSYFDRMADQPEDEVMWLYGVVQGYREKVIEMGADWYEWEYGPVVEGSPDDPFELAPAPQSVAQAAGYNYPRHCDSSFRRLSMCGLTLTDRGCKTWKKRFSWQVKKDCRRNSRVNWRTVVNCRRHNSIRRDCVQECRRYHKSRKHVAYRCGRW